MLGLGLPELLVILAVVALFVSYKKLPDAARAVGRSVRILRAETRGLTEDDVAAKAAAKTSRGSLGEPPTGTSDVPADQRG